MKLFIKMKCLIPLALRQLCNRNAGPFGDNLCNLVLRHIFMHQA